MTSSDDRHRRGNEAMTRIHGTRGQGYVSALAKFAPDFAAMLVDFGYGDIYARPGLDAKSRQFVTIAALTALGDTKHELTIHIRSALEIGCTRAEVIEVIMQMAVYAGFPRALAALSAARAAFDEADAAAATP